jgi:DNA invertase Pin-like site-specific DNA recombinase
LKETNCFGNLSHYSSHGVEIKFMQEKKNIDVMKRHGRFDFQILAWNETLEPTTSS